MILVNDFTRAATLGAANRHKFIYPALHAASMALFLTIVAPIILPSAPTTQLKSNSHSKSDDKATGTQDKNSVRSTILADDIFIGAYGGVPYTYPSDVHTKRPNGTDFTMRDVTWRGEPFKSPIYYGARVAKWSDRAPFGFMVDFTHSKAIANREGEVEQSGKINNKPIPPRAKIEDTFRKLEFSHGHNMLTLNGLYRLPVRVGNISPYLGLGGGISIPHTEIQFTGDLTRTYEYQYTGPALQALFGLEFQLPKMSIFLEYKFTFADYIAPLTFRNGVYVPQDLWTQFQNWWAGKSGENGTLSTKLVSHQLIGGFGMRILRNPVH